MRRGGSIGLLALLAASTSRIAAAQEASSSAQSSGAAASPRWMLGAGLGLALALNDSETASFDTVEVSSLLFAELVLEPMVFVAPSVSVGIRGGWGFEIGSRALESSSGARSERERHVWQLAPAARYQEQGGRGWYLGGNVGIAGITDSLGEQSVTQVAPLLSAALGLDLPLATPFSLGLELRATYAMFSEEGARLPASEPGQGAWYRYGPTGWLGFSLLGRFLL
jgi:hypothetical protein